MKKEYTISVIMGIYNCAGTLQEALDSLYAQTFQDFEIILCDDGSSDNTYELAAKNAKEHSNIVLLRNENNLGLNATLNKCLAVAKGRYIARMDGDDMSVSDRFEKEYNFLESHPEYAIVSCNMIHFDENGEFGKGKKKAAEVFKKDFPKGTPFCHAPCMVLKEAYIAVEGYSVANWLLRVEDYHLWYKMYLKGFKGYNLSEHLYMVRDDRNAATRKKFKNRLKVAYIKYLIIRDFKLSPINYIHCLRPIIVGLLPRSLYRYLHKSKLS